MSRTRVFATAIACLALVVGAFALLYRNDLFVAYHRQRLASEIKAWQSPPAAGESKDYRNYSRVETELSNLVALAALDRVELQIRLYTDGAMAPLPSLDRIQNGQNPAPVFSHIKGDPRTQPQTVVIWCDPSDTLYWKRFADSTLINTTSEIGEPSDGRGAAESAFPDG
ncbi:hypothetical protein Pla22_52430 [Rubripirellula amarantea]|uniref:Uncharacterized protein n=1 Tax=Rubripirellula amarantea TaxID=2527999 RepID=A0A5C5WAE6_9BACT|nr:hypothetical protein [Rubripirellula amarantea]TWT47876.1 hypothetical protein Pla22_52430 [Rubripirellula amarantea]